jgi:O-antigen ligase
MGSPVALAIYLVLGIPLLLSEVMGAERRGARDFWVACATISFVGVFFTQTLIGLVALLVTGSIFLSRRRRHAAVLVVVLATGAALLSLVAAPGVPLRGLGDRLDEWILGNGAGAPLADRTRLRAGERSALSGPGVPAVTAEPPAFPPVTRANMHVMLLLEHGLAGWLVLMWVIVAALRMMTHAYRRTGDARLRRTLWAIISSVVGFLVSMNALDAFHHLPIQIFFWSLVGIGLGIVTHLEGARRLNMIWRFGASGD